MSLMHNTADATAAAEGSGHACGCAQAQPQNGLPRRTAVLAGVGLAAALTAGCASHGGSSTAVAPAAGGAADAGRPSSPAAGGSGGTAGAAGGQALVKTSEVPVGGGVVVDQKYVVTQPQQGQFKAFSAICTHAGCPVSSVSGGTINCPCHGSKFHVADGSVANGPAPAPLAAQNITVSGDSVHLA
ncbi:Rieske (2Fe-2S) protein [Peterkaempfera sp. SMS 1(5)a]|uniref:Rieske (2Fe-2S) protein n=1 Tax=Peterkaempfera podocarpi TaxID=3232308 RepID=UPI0036708099